MGAAWAKNAAIGFYKPLSDEEMSDIPYPALEVGTHVTFKTAQAGSLIGYGLFSPFYYVYLKRKQYAMRDAVRLSRRLGLRTAAVFALLGPGLLYSRVHFAENLDEEAAVNKMKDRAYRLRHNRNQLNTDRVTAVAAVTGLGFNGLHGSVMFIAWGLLGSFAYNNILRKKVEGE